MPASSPVIGDVAATARTRQTSHHKPSLRIILIVFGSIALLAAALWCVVGAGIYGSPLEIMQGNERTRVLAFILFGPLAACAASLLALRQPRIGAIGLILGGLVSGILAMTFARTDAGPYPLVLLSLTMVALGCWRIMTVDDATGSRAPSITWTFIDMALCIATLYGTFRLVEVLWMYDVVGVRDALKLVRADALASILIVTALTLLATIFRARLFHIRWSILAGAWWAVVLALAYVLL